MSDPRTTGPVLRVSERCPDCRGLLLLRHMDNGPPVIACNLCNFEEPYDVRAEKLLRRILFLCTELTRRDPDASLWEERP